MGSRQLTVFSFVLACIRLSDSQFRSASVPIHWGAEAQKPEVTAIKPTGEPEREHSGQPAQHVSRLQSKQQQQAENEQLSWKFPEHPVAPVNKTSFKFTLRQPVVTNRVAVRCGESKVFVEVSQDLLGRGKLIKPEEITLGGCSATEIDNVSHVLVFESELHRCGSKLLFTRDAFIYAFMLVYNPKVYGKSGIMRSQRAVIGVECHYRRQHSANSYPEHPAWFSKHAKLAEEQSYFSLQLMTDDWKSERTSNKYALVDVINIQASVLPQPQTPRRVLVDSCVATVQPDSTSEPRKVLIKNNGCLGGQDTSSRFMPQSRPDELQFQVAAESLGLRGTIYISCRLKAFSASAPVTIENKACSFYNGKWRAVTGKDGICTCCQATCGMRKIRDLGYKMGERQEAEVTLGLIIE